MLEPSSHPAVRPFKDALMEDGIPYTSFSVNNFELEHARLEKQGVRFIQPPVTHGGYSTAVFDDTCGNLIQIIEIANKD